MKKTILILTLFLAAFYGDLIAQTCIEYKNTGIIIRPNIIGSESNIIRYDVTCPISQLDTAQQLLNIVMTCKAGVCSYGTQVSVVNLPDIFHTTKFEQSDVGVYVDMGMQKFACAIIKGYGLLKLGEDWTIKNK